MKLIPDRAKAPIVQAIDSLSLTSKAIFAVFVAIFVISAGILAYRANSLFLIEVPRYGGTVNIGIVGTPRLINPVLVQNESGRDIVDLVYAGLMKRDPQGNLTPDMASSYTVSDDGKTITFTLKSGLFFQDGVKVTADDVVFTIQKIEDSALKSPRHAYWDGIKVEAIDDLHVKFTLNRSVSEVMNEMTVGILPKHIWGSVSNDEFPIIEYNTQPIGSGPYTIDTVKRGRGGLATEYTLRPFSQYQGTPALISNLNIFIYQNDNDALSALKSGTINELGALSPDNATTLATNSVRIETRALPRVFALFFNQSQSAVLADSAVRKALNLAAPRDNIVDQIFHGFATPLQGPLPDFMSPGTATSTLDASSSFAQASRILDRAGWIMGDDGIRVKRSGKTSTQLAFNIATSDVPDLKNVATLLKETWGNLGVNIMVNVYESGDLNQNIIRQRHYDTLLFGEVITEESDLYAFWHSSQRKDPGLNVSLYTNLKVDKALESMRISTSTDLTSFNQTLLNEFSTDVPAVFLYSPLYIEAVPQTLSGYSKGALHDPSDRFGNANLWYLETEDVWPWFAHMR